MPDMLWWLFLPWQTSEQAALLHSLQLPQVPQPQKASACSYLMDPTDGSELDGSYCATPVFGPLLALTHMLG